MCHLHVFDQMKVSYIYTHSLRVPERDLFGLRPCHRPFWRPSGPSLGSRAGGCVWGLALAVWGLARLLLFLRFSAVWGLALAAWGLALFWRSRWRGFAWRVGSWVCRSLAPPLLVGVGVLLLSLAAASRPLLLRQLCVSKLFTIVLL